MYQHKIIQKSKQILTLFLAVVLFFSSSLNVFADKLSDNHKSINLFESNNLNLILQESLNDIINKDYTNKFINKKFNSIENLTPELKKTINDLIFYINNTDVSIEDSQMHIFKSLETIQNHFCLDKDIKKQDLFVQYIYGMKKAYQVAIAKRVADSISKEYSTLSDEEIEKTTQLLQFQAGGKGTVTPGVNVGTATSYKINSEMADTAFYTINIGKSFKLGVDVEIPKLFSINAGLETDLTNTAIFYCLEQLLDSNNPDLLKLTSSSVKQIAASREKMQKLEKELLSIFSTYIECFLKSMGIISQQTIFEWPNISKTVQAETATSFSVSPDASLSALSDTLSAQTKVTCTKKIYSKPSEYLSLIKDDCSPENGLSIDDIINILGDSYDILDTELYSNIDYAIPYVLSEIKYYNSILTQLSIEPGNKNLEKSKHKFEDRWFSKNHTSKGRSAVLKSMIIASIKLNKNSKNPKHTENLKNLYFEITKLIKLQEFSKDKDSRNATFQLNAVATNYALDGSINVSVPCFGDAKINIIRTRLRNNPFQQENGDYTQFRLSAPTPVLGIMGLKALRKELHKKLKLNKSDLLSLSSEAIDLIIENSVLSCLNPDSSYTTLSLMMVRTSPENKCLKSPLPGQKKVYIKSKNEWTIQYFQIMSNLGAGVNVDCHFLNLEANSSIGIRDRIIGDNTLTYIAARYNAFYLGLKASGKQENTPWNLFKEKQNSRLEKLFLNLNNKESNVYYELQVMYNTIISNLSLEEDILECQETFKCFLTNCKIMKKFKDINHTEYDTAKTNAFSYFDKIMELNHNHNFMISYNQSYSKDSIK